jgi:hypothetical protein
MAELRHLIVVLPGIGGSVLAQPGKPDDVVWDAGKGDIADLVFRPGRMSLQESPCLQPLGLTESTKFLGFTIVPGYEKLLNQLTAFGTIDRRGDPRHPEPGASVVAVPYDFRYGVVEAAERLDAVVCAPGRRQPGRARGAGDRGGAFDGWAGRPGLDGAAGPVALVPRVDHPGRPAP